MQVSDFAVGGGWWVQDHGWLAGWLRARTAILDLVHVLASILRKTLVANSRQQRARMHENLNISGTSNHRGWWVVSALLALPQLCRTAPKAVGGWVGFDTVRTL